MSTTMFGSSRNSTPSGSALPFHVYGDVAYICCVHPAKFLFFHRRGFTVASMVLRAILVSLGSVPVSVCCKTPWILDARGRWCIKHGLHAVGAFSSWAACPSLRMASLVSCDMP